MQVTLNDLLLLRKELNGQLERASHVRREDFLVLKTKRGTVQDGFQDLIAEVPRVSFADACKGYNEISMKLRQVDGEIQRLNHTTTTEAKPEWFEVSGTSVSSES